MIGASEQMIDADRCCCFDAAIVVYCCRFAAAVAVSLLFWNSELRTFCRCFAAGMINPLLLLLLLLLLLPLLQIDPLLVLLLLSI